MKNNNYIDLGERGRYNIKNKLNNLTGKEWIKFTKSWFIHKPLPRKGNEILHPAKFPESLVEGFISFFTKENGLVFDPFLGTGSVLLASGKLGRNAVGIELNKKYFEIAKQRVEKEKFENSILAINGSSKNLKDLLPEYFTTAEKFDFVITSPPYWNQLKRNSIRQKQRLENNLDTKYSDDENDIGNIDDYNEFIEKQAEIFDVVFDATKEKGYLVIITNNVFFNGKLFPLAFDTAI